MKKRYLFSLALCLSMFSQSHGQDKEAIGKPETVNYLISIDSDLKLNNAGKDNLLKVKTRVRYQNARRANKLVVYLQNLWIRGEAGKRELMFMELNKDLLRIKDGGEVIELKPGDAKEFNEIFTSMTKPAGAVTLDKNGKELSRKILQKSNDFINFNGILRNTRWFHPRHPTEKAWSETRDFDLGEGRNIRGPIKFTVLDKKDSNGHLQVKLTGVMTKKEAKSKDATYSNVKYIFDGQLSFNETRKIWVGGLTTVKVAYQVLTAQGLTNATGTMTLKHQLATKANSKTMKVPPKLEKAKKDAEGAVTVKGKLHSYKLFHRVLSNISVQGQDVLIKVNTDVRYDNIFTDKSALDLRLRTVKINATQNGKETMLFDVNKDLFHSRQGGRDDKFTYKDGSPGIRALLKQLFRSSYASIKLDKDGRELKRDLHNNVNGRALFSNMIFNVRWFHAGFPATKTWTEKRVFDLGRGGTISGPMTFTKQDRKEGDSFTTVKVAGTFTKAEAKTKQGTLKNIKYIFEGEQRYDEKRKIWVSGEHKVKVSYQILVGTTFAKSTGSMKLTLTMPKDK